ncbi:MAG: phosphoribosylformylglycinamidine synthase subunit PurL [Planctomycetota bacterium]
MHWKIEVTKRPAFGDPHGEGILGDIRDLGIASIERVRSARVYVITGEFGALEAQRVAGELLSDPVDEEFGIETSPLERDYPNAIVRQVVRRPGVMEPAEASVLKGIADMGLSASSVRIARKYAFVGKAAEEELSLIAGKVLANECIEEVVRADADLSPPESAQYALTLRRVALAGADADRLREISRAGQLFLNVEEMRTIQRHFEALGREPTDVELETLAQTWSEHCVHKTLKGRINCDGEVIDNLLASTIARVTRELARPWCLSVFKDNAGVIAFDDEHAVCFKVETHNHPSAIEPYGGAGTGTGGVIRDILGTGLGAKPILSTDVFCFGPPDLPKEKLPKGTLHPKRVMKGVVAGVRDYGNRMGIPTANGAVYFDERFVGNPLVYCGNIGILPRDKCEKGARTGDLILVVGGRTGRDGIHGATFSSGELTEESETVSSGAVQIGNPITEKKMLDVLMVARDRGLYTAITDCGAGGLSSAVGEMGAELGAQVHLERVPLKYEGLSYTEIWISEAQERMVLAVPPDRRGEILQLFASEDVEATVIGCYTDDRRLKLFWEKCCVCDLGMEFLHEGLPKLERSATWAPRRFPEPHLPEKRDYTADLLALLAAPNIASKEWVIRQYDHEVQGGTVLKPLVGVRDEGPSDACVVTPVLGSKKGIIVACGLNPCYSDIDPYAMAAAAIDEALRQVVAVGGRRDRTALLDNFCWGNTDKPDRLGGLVRAAKACYDVARVYETPFISGKDSLNNEYATADGTIVIPGCLLISAISVVDDVSKTISMDLKAQGSMLFLVGLTKREMGGSHYWKLAGAAGECVPRVDAALGRRVFDAVTEAVERGLVLSAHDLSEGGFAVAAAEMAFAGMVGAEIDLGKAALSGDVTRDDEILFSESVSRLLLEVPAGVRNEFERTLGDVPFAAVGRTTGGGRLVVKGRSGARVIDAALDDLCAAWKRTFDW